MKTSKWITLVMMGLALSATPALAQRGGGSRGGGGSHSSSSMSSSRSSGGGHSSFSSSSSRSSSSSSSSRSSFSSSSRSSSDRSSSFRNSSRSDTPRSSSIRSGIPSRSEGVRSSTSSPRGEGIHSSASARSERVRANTADRTSRGISSSMGGARQAGTISSTDRKAGRPTAPSSSNAGGMNSPHPGVRDGGYARPGHPGGYLPPAARPIHPAPYFHHPWYGYVVHCHPIFWDPLPPRPWYWPGFWVYCNSYWYDYHVTDVVVVHDYVEQTYKVDLVTYGISGDIMYAIVKDHGDTYLQVYDKDDHLLAEQKIHRKYCNMVIDAENGGCWISKKHNKDALLFIWADNQLLIYEAD